MSKQLPSRDTAHSLAALTQRHQALITQQRNAFIVWRGGLVAQFGVNDGVNAQLAPVV